MENKTTMIEMELIKVSDRIRKDFGDIDQLAQDIKENGLINPILVTPDYELIAGERRYRAIKSLGWKTIEVRVMSVRDALHKLRLEISENEYRKDFSFREKIEWSNLLENEYSKLAKENMSDGGKGFKASEKLNTAKTVAKEVGFGSTDTYYKAKFIHKYGNDSIFDDLDNGKATINGVYKKLKSKMTDDCGLGKTKTTSQQTTKGKTSNQDESDELHELRERVKQLERDKQRLAGELKKDLEEVKRRKDGEISRYKAMYESEKRLKEQYQNMARFAGGTSAGLEKSEYRKLVKVCHPDNGGTEELMNIISKLYKK